MKQLKVLLSAVLLCISGGLMAQSLVSTSSNRAISIEQALEEAFTGSPQLEAAFEGEKAAMHSRKAAFGLHLPSLSLSASYTMMSKDIGHIDFNPQKEHALEVIGGSGLPIPPNIAGAIQGLDLSYTLQPKNFGMVGANIVMPIYMGSKINAANAAAKITERQVSAQTSATRCQLFTTTATRYWDLVLAMQLYELRANTLEAMKSGLYSAQKLEQNGMISQTEVLYAQMNYQTAQAELLSANSNLRSAQESLASSLGVVGEFTPSTPLVVLDSIPSLDYFREQIMEHNPVIRQVELTQSLAHQGVRVARSGFFPEVALMGGYDIYSYQLSNQLPKWIVGAGIKLNLFDGLNREHNYSSARSRQRQAEAMGHHVNEQIILAAEKLYNEIQSSRAQYMASESGLVFAHQYLSAKQKAQREGMATVNDVVDAQLALVGMQTQRLALGYKFNLLLINLKALAGQDTL